MEQYVVMYNGWCDPENGFIVVPVEYPGDFKNVFRDAVDAAIRELPGQLAAHRQWCADLESLQAKHGLTGPRMPWDCPISEVREHLLAEPVRPGEFVLADRRWDLTSLVEDMWSEHVTFPVSYQYTITTWFQWAQNHSAAMRESEDQERVASWCSKTPVNKG